jgi:hypothetical protein
MKALISNKDSMSLQPLSSDDVAEYLKKGPSLEEIERIDARLKEIDDFIRAYGEGNAPLAEKMRLENDQRRYKTRKHAIEKVNSEVERVVDLISSQKGVELAKFDPDRHQFMYTILKKVANSGLLPCGLQGSVDERIRDCSYQSDSKQEGFVVVTRTSKNVVVYKEVSTGLLWSKELRYEDKSLHWVVPLVPLELNYAEAQRACNSRLREFAGIDKSWRLPSINEYKVAERHGISKVTHGLFYWSSSPADSSRHYAWMFRNYDGTTHEISRNLKNNVQCVAR